MAQKIALHRALDAFGNDRGAVQPGDGEQCLQQRLALGNADPGNELAVDLDHIDGMAAQDVRPDVTGAEIVDREAQAQPAQLAEKVVALRTARDGWSGDFETEPVQREAAPVDRLQRRQEPLRMVELRWREIDTDPVDNVSPVERVPYLDLSDGFAQHPVAKLD